MPCLERSRVAVALRMGVPPGRQGLRMTAQVQFFCSSHEEHAILDRLIADSSVIVFSLDGMRVQELPQFSPEKLEFKPDRLNPIGGLGRLFSPAALVKGLLGLLKIAAFQGLQDLRRIGSRILNDLHRSSNGHQKIP